MGKFLKPEWHLLIFIFLLLIADSLQAQQCQSTVVIQLENIKGGFFQGQKVTLTSRADGKTFFADSDDRGVATLKVPCGEIFDVTIPNYTKKVELESSNGGTIKQSLVYDPEMVQKKKMLAMSADEQRVVDNHFKSLKDTTVMKTSIMPPPAVMPNYSAMVIISIRNIEDAPLANETLTITGRKRGKSIKATTDKNGRLITYLPKGDTYDIHFKYNKNFYSTSCSYSKGSTDIKIGFSYMGTKEVERRRKVEAERLLAEEARLKAEKEAFEKRCKSMGLTLEECHRKEIEDYLKSQIGFADTVISRVLSRNQWEDKVIICDVTGSMNLYVGQLSLWYRLNYLREKNLQFVLFNDGDNKPDEAKQIGDTGGIYYSKSKGVDSLDYFMSRVQSLGSGGDAPENNMEALIKGIKMAGPFKEIVMIVDNHAPIKDISLLGSFHQPVHIILCGAAEGGIMEDYLMLAWKTKGTIHTIESDITTMARMSEGQKIIIGGFEYRIMGGEFVQINKR